MKYKYEDFFIVSLIFILVLLFELIFLFMLFNFKIRTYKVFNGVVVKDNIVEVMVRKDKLNLFYDNKFIYIRNKKIKFNILQIERNIIKGYHCLLLEFKFKDKKVNDVCKFSIFNKKIRLISIYQTIWKGDSYEYN